jgi:hypothetical protein
VRMMPPAYVKPYIRRQKNDASDAAAICEAVTRPTMRFVGVRSLKNQAALMRHKAREMLVSQRTQLLNALSNAPEALSNGLVSIFVPGAPNPHSGSVFFFSKLAAGLGCLRRCGVGASALGASRPSADVRG